MQNKILIAALIAPLLLAGCMELGKPYADGLSDFTVRAVYPDGYSARAGAVVTVESISGGSAYKLETNASGVAATKLPNGIYRVTVHDRDGSDVFNGSAEKIIISGTDISLDISLLHSKAGTLVIKELYCGGCSKVPEEGTTRPTST